MHKNIITVILSCLIGFFLVYLFGIFYFYESLDKTRNDRKYHLKDMEALTFHKKYTSKLHHLNGKPGVQDEVNTVPENYLFAVVNEFAEKKNKILIQGDSYAETLTWYRNTYNFLNEFSNKNDVGLINAGIASYSPSLMSLQLDVLEKDFNIYPNIIVAYFDQSDVGDEICRYKNKRIFDKNGKLIRVKEKKYSGNIFNYTKIHNESEILLSQKSKFRKAVELMNFNLKYRILKQKYKLSKKIKNIKKYGWKGRKFVKCYWSEIERPLIENNKEEIDYFKNRIKDYLQKVSSKKHVEKIFIVTFPHKANLFPTKNKLGQEIYYKANVQKLVEEVLVGFDNIELINFNEEFKGREKYFYDNAYIEFDPHLKENFHFNLFTKTIIKNLEAHLNNSL